MNQHLRILTLIICAVVVPISAGFGRSYPSLLLVDQVPPSPAVRAFSDNAFWITVEDMSYSIGSTSERIVVPRGFVTE